MTTTTHHTTSTATREHGLADQAAPLDVRELAARFDRSGLPAVARDLDLLARTAQALGVDTPSVHVLADPSEAAVVRARAFSLVVRHLARLPDVTSRRFVAVA